ncbi:acetyl-CoA carboxylase biotin carboxylase subunit [Gemmatimonadota bacterium]
MFRKVLIANRGEIALRVIRACRELGVGTVAVFSEADADALHVRFADEEVCIGPPQSAGSYLNIPHLIAAAEITNAEAIHPGYGFLAENAGFADVCEEHGITFIGPTSEQIRLMGDKAQAKTLMSEAGVPVTPGSGGIVPDLEAAREVADEIGYPVMIKATAGGGGKGMKLALSPDELELSLTLAQSEGKAAFGNPDCYIEKAIIEPRHVEVQLMGDGEGNAVHMGERDCSCQRRHQKLVEESPSPAVTPEMRAEIGAAAVEGAKRVDYRGAGTIEFLLDRDGRFYFMEMNTRIQVEHPVTEEVTGLDLVKEQIRIAAGEGLSVTQEEISFEGHSIECRINAEDPDNNFTPSPGRIESLHKPGGNGIRVDTHIYAGYVIPPFYDSLLGKLICWAPTRAEAIARMKGALEEFVIEGVKTTIPLHLRIMSDPVFIEGHDVNTSYIPHLLAES